MGCLSVCLSVCLPACLLPCLPASLPACFPACLASPQRFEDLYFAPARTLSALLQATGLWDEYQLSDKHVAEAIQAYPPVRHTDEAGRDGSGRIPSVIVDGAGECAWCRVVDCGWADGSVSGLSALLSMSGWKRVWLVSIVVYEWMQVCLACQHCCP